MHILNKIILIFSLSIIVLETSNILINDKKTILINQKQEVEANEIKINILFKKIDDNLYKIDHSKDKKANSIKITDIIIEPYLYLCGLNPFQINSFQTNIEEIKSNLQERDNTLDYSDCMNDEFFEEYNIKNKNKQYEIIKIIKQSESILYLDPRKRDDIKLYNSFITQKEDIKKELNKKLLYENNNLKEIKEQLKFVASLELIFRISSIFLAVFIAVISFIKENNIFNKIKKENKK